MHKAALAEQMKMGIHRKVSMIVALVAIPFAISGGCIWRQGVAATQTTQTSFYYYDFMGSAAYELFGFPLTGIAMRAMFPLRFEDHWWQIPILSLLVVFQWVLWANVLAWIGRRLRDRRQDEGCQPPAAV